MSKRPQTSKQAQVASSLFLNKNENTNFNLCKTKTKRTSPLIARLLLTGPLSVVVIDRSTTLYQYPTKSSNNNNSPDRDHGQPTSLSIMAWQEVLLILTMVAISTSVAFVLLFFFIKPVGIEIAHFIAPRIISARTRTDSSSVSARTRTNSSSVDPVKRKKIVIKSLVISVSAEDNNRKIESVT